MWNVKNRRERNSNKRLNVQKKKKKKADPKLINNREQIARGKGVGLGRNG